MKLSDRVQSLIDAHKYDEAITLLANIDSPKATDWIRRIEAQRTVYQTKSKQQAAMWIVGTLFFCSCICPMYFWFAS
jgi:hypothetical protein